MKLFLYRYRSTSPKLRSACLTLQKVADSRAFSSLFRKVSVQLGIWLLILLLSVSSSLHLFHTQTDYHLYLLFQIETIGVVWIASLYIKQVLLSSLKQRHWLSVMAHLLLVYLSVHVVNCFTYWYVSQHVKEKVFEPYFDLQVLFQPFYPTVFATHFSFVFAYVAILTIFTILSHFTQMKNKALQLERDNLVLELNFLKSQVNPHFLFNSLNNIYSMIICKDNAAVEVILKLSNLMRYALYESEEAAVPLEKEIQFLQDYIDLERIRHSKEVLIDLQINTTQENISIPPLLLVIFVENAFKHGVNSSIKSGWVKVQLHIQDDALLFMVTNSKGKALNRISTVDRAPVGGVGLQNARKRLDILYPNKHSLGICETNEIFDLNLKLSLQ